MRGQPFHLLLLLAPATGLVVAPTLTPSALETISRGGVHVVPNWLPLELQQAMRADALGLFAAGYFSPDGLTNNAKSKAQQGFSAADRQTFKGDAWASAIGDTEARLEFARRMRALRLELADGLGRPTLALDGERKHEMTYNWYEPHASLGRHLDEHHEETKGPKGWTRPTRRSVTWLVYLNDGWSEAEGGGLRTYPRAAPSLGAVGSDRGHLQVGWLDGLRPVFLDAFMPSGGSCLYALQGGHPTRGGGAREVLSAADFETPPQPIDFAPYLPPSLRPRFEQISTARLDPRFAAQGASGGYGGATTDAALLVQNEKQHHFDVAPRAGKLVLFDSVSLPHLVRPVTGSRQRIAATGWFHEDSMFSFG